jgi:hypothetical protein
MRLGHGMHAVHRGLSTRVDGVLFGPGVSLGFVHQLLGSIVKARGVPRLAVIEYGQLHRYHSVYYNARLAKRVRYLILPPPSLPALDLFSKQPTHPPQDAVLLWVIRVVFARDFENRRECLRVCIDPMPYPVRNL